jgi:hypothetical protein
VIRGSALAARSLTALIVVGTLTACGPGASHTSGYSMRLVNNTPSTVTAEESILAIGETNLAAKQSVAQRGCTPPIGGCVLAKYVLSPGKTAEFPIPKNFDDPPARVVTVTGYGSGSLCLPVVPGPPADRNPTFTVSGMIRGDACGP